MNANRRFLGLMMLGTNINILELLKIVNCYSAIQISCAEYVKIFSFEARDMIFQSFSYYLVFQKLTLFFFLFNF